MIVVAATGQLTRKAEQMRFSTDRYEKSCVHKPWHSWGCSTSPVSVGRTTQLDLGNPRGFWNMLW